MDKQQVLEQFAALAKISLEEALTHAGLVDASIAQITAMLRDDADPVKNASLLHYVCGAVCYHKFALLQGGAKEETVRALDVSATKKLPESWSNAERLRDDALVLARRLLLDERFYAGS